MSLIVDKCNEKVLMSYSYFVFKMKKFMKLKKRKNTLMMKVIDRKLFFFCVY